jgi:hypothetical protein
MQPKGMIDLTLIESKGASLRGGGAHFRRGFISEVKDYFRSWG